MLPVTDVITAVLFTSSIYEGKPRLAAADDSQVFLEFSVGIVYYVYANSVCRAFVIVLGKRIETDFGYGKLPVDSGRCVVLFSEGVFNRMLWFHAFRFLREFRICK